MKQRVSANLFVANIGFGATERDLGQFFADAGFTPHSVRIMVDEEGCSKGWGFVEVAAADRDAAIAAVHGLPCGGRKLHVAAAKTREERGQRPPVERVRRYAHGA